MATTEARTGYAPIGDLDMYYEIHGEGRPLVLLHGAYMTVDMMGPLLAGLARTRQVIAAEQQGHGRTADVDRPITYEQMADDTAGADPPPRHRAGRRRRLQHGRRHRAAAGDPPPGRSCASSSSPPPSFSSDGMPAEALEMFPSITPELFAGTPIEEAYLRLAPNPGRLPEARREAHRLDTTTFAWPEEDIRAIAAPTLIVLGDSDGIRLEHAVELFKLRGGGVMGDLAGLPAVAARRAARHHRTSSRPGPGCWTAPTGCWR